MRVRLSEAGRGMDGRPTNQRLGRIVGRTHRGNPIVQWDGLSVRSVEPVHPSYLEGVVEQGDERA